ncbi:MAG: hypothetical protein NTW74_18590 [Acidobacteria bacterium]|nr:hypothetical protein [Acidobacteriota bacterium]
MNTVLKDAEAFVDKAESRFEAAKQKVSQAMESGSEQRIAGANAMKATAQNSADSLSDGAAYLRDRKPSQMLQDCTSLFRKYPLHALTLATIAGVLLGKSLWGKRERD